LNCSFKSEDQTDYLMNLKPRVLGLIN
jgi:hypothetical protein